ncbi:uncharacterized protein VP01_5310g1 [Puccinia sorghi]|uniref:AAA+ ATPase domain-containing protein n=1 Tax=Puccinia sorghi TaxID=27349 RepID=A0A0L6UK90_9BASI|nr:uncharacterized protein VP01_5310g1 [Puccinia sorghi]
MTAQHKYCFFGLVFSRILTVHNGRPLFSLFCPGTSVRGFFNRAREVDELSDLLKQKPRFTVLLGPPSSGKTALAPHVISKTRPDNTPEFHPLTIDLRASGKMKHSAEMAANIFNQLANRLKPWSPYQRNRPPILVIDEANAFKRMGNEIKAKMHVIFTLSDSLFESWLKQRRRHKIISCIWLKTINNSQKKKKDILTSIDFDIPFKMTGGRMFFLARYIKDVCISGYFDDPIRFRPVQLAYTVMEADLVGKANTYSEKEALTVCELLADSSGYLNYRALVRKLGSAVVEEMIERNFLHFRPVSDFSRDLIPLQLIPVVTARSEPALSAMEMFVKNYGQYE